MILNKEEVYWSSLAVIPTHLSYLFSIFIRFSKAWKCLLEFFGNKVLHQHIQANDFVFHSEYINLITFNFGLKLSSNLLEDLFVNDLRTVYFQVRFVEPVLNEFNELKSGDNHIHVDVVG